MDSHERADRQRLWPTDQKRTCEPEPVKNDKTINLGMMQSIKRASDMSPFL